MGREDGWPPVFRKEDHRIPPTGRLTVTSEVCAVSGGFEGQRSLFGLSEIWHHLESTPPMGSVMRGLDDGGREVTVSASMIHSAIRIVGDRYDLQSDADIRAIIGSGFLLSVPREKSPRTMLK